MKVLSPKQVREKNEENRVSEEEIYQFIKNECLQRINDFLLAGKSYFYLNPLETLFGETEWTSVSGESWEKTVESFWEDFYKWKSCAKISRIVTNGIEYTAEFTTSTVPSPEPPIPVNEYYSKCKFPIDMIRDFVSDENMNRLHKELATEVKQSGWELYSEMRKVYDDP